jgi:hypothetical protein
MEEKICSICGATNEADAKFCVGCAAEFSENQVKEVTETVEVEASTEMVEEAVSEVAKEQEVVQADVAKESATITGEFIEAGNEVAESVEVKQVVAPVAESVVVPPIIAGKKQKAPKEKKVKQPKQQPVVQEVVAPSNGGYAQKPVSVIAWIGLMFLRIIPLGVIIELVIALSSSNPTLKNYGKAKLILIIIGIILVIVAFITILPIIQDAYDEVYDILESFS